MILLFSVQQDVHLDSVIEHLRKRREPFVRLNTDDLGTQWQISCSDEGSKSSYYFTNRQNGKTVSWSDVGAVWYRRPSLPTISAPDLSPEIREFAAREIHFLVQYLLSALSPTEITWVSNPMAMSRANSRFLQTEVARRAGFRAPDAIITNDPDALRIFAQNLSSEWFAIKRISSHSRLEDDTSFFTSRIHRDDLLRKVDQVLFCPTLVQEYVPKACEYRITVIGDQVFCCRLLSQGNPAAEVDWRETSPEFVTHQMVTHPEIESKALQVVEHLGLSYGAIDLIEQPDGEIVFLEINPNGQWLWIEQITGARMSEAMASLLAEH